MAKSAPKGIISLSGCVSKITSTTAVGAVTDVGVYPRVLAFDMTEFLKTAVSRKDSFASCCA